MNCPTCIINGLLLGALALSGCSSDPNRTHRADLLDDKVTNQRVQSALNRSGNQFKSIQVQTTNGVVFLSGTVTSEETRARAEDIVRSLHRVRGLEDNLQVRK